MGDNHKYKLKLPDVLCDRKRTVKGESVSQISGKDLKK